MSRRRQRRLILLRGQNGAPLRQQRRPKICWQGRIQAAIDILAEEPRPPAAKRLVNFAGEWRVRVGDYRIVYDIHDDELVVLVLSAGHRREIYKR